MREVESTKHVLDLVITHYKSPWEVGKPWFDSVALQRGIDFKDIGVILVSDGEESRLDDSLFKEYPFEVINATIPHGGIPVSRNAGLDLANAEWVMVCDFDDSFLTVNALSMLIGLLKNTEKVMLQSDFYVEEVDKDGNATYGIADASSILNHGKLYNLPWLREKGIRFHPKLQLHEDVFFNELIRKVAGKDGVGVIKPSFYLWCFNPDSVSRNIPNWEIATYNHKIRQRTAIIHEFQKRGMTDDVELTVANTIVEAFYEFQRFDWMHESMKEQYEKAERYFCSFLHEYWGIYEKIDPRKTAALMTIIRNRIVDTGRFMAEVMTIREFLIHMVKDVEQVERDEWCPD